MSRRPRRRLFSPLRLLSPFTYEEIDALVPCGEHQTWPRTEMIRICIQVSRTLEEILSRVDHSGIEPLH